MKQDVINLCLEQGSATLHAVNDLYHDFVRECGGAQSLPNKFTLDIPAMANLGNLIEEAIDNGDLRKTQELCDEYKTRFTSYIEGWRKKRAQKEAVLCQPQ